MPPPSDDPGDARGAPLPLARARDLWDADPGWLNTASYGLPPRPAVQDLNTVIDQWRHGSTDWRAWDAATGRARDAFAALVGADAADVAVGTGVAQALSVVAASLPPDAEVLVPAEEFTSNLFPWAVSARLRTAPMARLAEEVTARTRLVAFSLVQSATGEIAPADDILAAARAHDALTVTDATQACGWLPVSATRFDVLTCAAYKWLMAPRGAAYTYLSPRARQVTRPIAAGWYAGADEGGSFYGPPLRLAPGARAFDASPAWFSQVGAATAMELINRIGVRAIHDHDTALAARFSAALGLPPTGSAIVTADGGDQAERRLAEAGIRAAVRAGRVRVAFHLYNDSDDADRAAAALTGRP
ncbi:aminotransferase class V-fold PLP-dependent enzyme [Spongiactinospora sp. TRM90649]|uniref:aminotransferase class V-fold PLP-dependent enzyme n=1 Tax=Spongiactinospora sp. TRM90649 TaxID=3031114 RepID=UPI0023F94955|nr:aminotransferase class V-fold PLP-dependent enzyme [Spongiactinospora sp. TRM90649]MDF5756692.1 aminotransferase class V-fold PLP-dependent enzyme [Spongiactinospora sp. TRM90649]